MRLLPRSRAPSAVISLTSCGQVLRYMMTVLPKDSILLMLFSTIFDHPRHPTADASISSARRDPVKLVTIFCGRHPDFRPPIAKAPRSVKIIHLRGHSALARKHSFGLRLGFVRRESTCSLDPPSLPPLREFVPLMVTKLTKRQAGFRYHPHGLRFAHRTRRSASLLPPNCTPCRSSVSRTTNFMFKHQISARRSVLPPHLRSRITVAIGMYR